MVTRVVFVFDPEWPHIGSTVMRGEQLSRIVRDHASGWRVGYRPLGSRIRGSRVFLTKNSARRLDSEGASELLRDGNRLFVPIVDSPAPEWTADVPCVLVAASHTSFSAIARRHPNREVVLVDHHVDPRIPPPPASYPRFAVGYFGELFNAQLTPAIEEIVDTVEVSTATQEPGWFARVADYPLHYAIRRRIAQDDVKPFLKGFTAAAVGANVLAARSDAEATAWLGEDYPFLIDDTDEASVLAGLESAREAWATPRWTAGLDIMAGVRERISPDRVARQVLRALSV